MSENPDEERVSPEQHLILAVMTSAADDLIAPRPVGHARLAWERYRDDAYTWFFTEDRQEEVFSFEWCCLSLGWSAERIRAGLRQGHPRLLKRLTAKAC